MEQSFYGIVPGAAGTDQAFSQTVDGLVMGRVYQGTAAIEIIKEIFAVKYTVIDIVCLVFSYPFMTVCGSNVLIDTAAKVDIDDLKTFADTQDGFMLCHIKREGIELQYVQFCVYLTGAMICLAEEGRCDIPAPGQKQMTCAGCFFGIQGGLTGNIQPPEGGFIIGSVFAAAKNGNGRGRMHGNVPFWCIVK